MSQTRIQALGVAVARMIRDSLDLVRPVHGRAPRSRVGRAPLAQRFHAHPESADAAPHVCVVVGGGAARARRLRCPLVGAQRRAGYKDPAPYIKGWIPPSVTAGAASAQIQSLADQRGRPLRLRLTGGQRHDRSQARAWGEAWIYASLLCLIADRAYDRDAFRAWLAPRDIKAVLPARSRRLNPSPMTRNGTRRATPWNGALAGSSTGGA